MHLHRVLRLAPLATVLLLQLRAAATTYSFGDIADTTVNGFGSFLGPSININGDLAFVGANAAVGLVVGIVLVMPIRDGLARRVEAHRRAFVDGFVAAASDGGGHVHYRHGHIVAAHAAQRPPFVSCF